MRGMNYQYISNTKLQNYNNSYLNSWILKYNNGIT